LAIFEIFKIFAVYFIVHIVFGYIFYIEMAFKKSLKKIVATRIRTWVARVQNRTGL
jgi:hypothetical protein